MANISKYVYQNLITLNGSRPYLYKDSDDILYTVMSMKNDDSTEWLDLYYSIDDGETWTLDENLPINTYPLYDAKIIVIDTTWYVFAHGMDSNAIDTIYFIKKTVDTSSTSDTITMVWDETWTKLFSDTTFNNRVTDICTDDNGSFIHLLFDQLNSNNKYAVHYAMLSTADYALKYNVVINSKPSVNQHNGKIMLLTGNTLAMSWEEENYNGLSQIFYTQYDYINQEWNQFLQLTSDDIHNNYHQTMTRDSNNVVYLTWLNTKDSYATDNINVTSIVDMEQKEVTTISNNAKNNQYPYITCDEYDCLYVLYNLASESIQYLKKAYSSSTWTSVTELSNNNWQMLYGYCVNSNLYTIVRQDNEIYFVRIDTDLAEVFAPISDLQIASITNSSVSFAWTPVRNAEKIYLQELEEDSWQPVALITPLSVTDNSAVGIDLPAGKLKFRVEFTRTDKTKGVLYLNGTLDNDKKQNINLSWQPPNNIVSQTLEYSIETWNDLCVIPNKNYFFSCDFDGRITKFRFRVVGGVAEGVSNEVRPLTISLDGQDLVLEWTKLKDSTYLEVQQSIDGDDWYTATTKEPISKDSEKATITNLNEVTYRYRLAYLVNSVEQYSNWVSLTNNLKCTASDYKSATLQWTSIDGAENYKFQYSIDGGVNWTTSVNPITNCSTVISKLNYDTDYLFRMYFPGRFTGVYSNIISVKTSKKPVDDLSLVSLVGTVGTFKFSIKDSYSSISFYALDLNTDETIDGEVENVSHVISTPTATKTEIQFVINNFKKGHYYSVFVMPNGSHYGDLSNQIDITTTGNSPKNITCTKQDKHSIVFHWDDLAEITSTNVSSFVYIQYSMDGIIWNEEIVDAVNDFELKNLMQNTTYQVKLICLYGENYGVSDIITVKTLASNFEPVYGDRLPNERSFVYNSIDKLFYIFDRGKIYTYNETTKDQFLLVDYGIKANHIYSAMKCDKNGNIHLVFTCGKQVVYCTNCKGYNSDGDSVQHKIEEGMIIESNALVNEYLNPDLQINSKNNVVMIVWEEDFGYCSNVSGVWYRNGELYQEQQELVNNTLHNHAPKIALKNSGGWYLACIDTEPYMNIVESVLDNDYTSSTYLQETLTTEQIKIKNVYTDNFNNFSVCTDNLDGLRLFYDSVTDGTKTSTYGTYIDNKYEQVAVYGESLQDTQLIAKQDLLLVGRSVAVVYTAKYSVESQAFTDLMEMGIDTIDDNPLCMYYDSKNVYVLSFNSGEFLIQTKAIKDISQNNNYVNNIWIDNKFSLQNDEDDYMLEIWTSGDINYYPSLFIKCNKTIREITPLDEFGYRINKSIKVNSVENIDLTDSTEVTRVSAYLSNNTKAMIEIKFNTTESLFVDLTDFMYYSWDNTTIIKSASK